MIELSAPAKLTVSLRIVGVRDDGYHLIDAEMMSLGLADRLVLTDGDGLDIDGPFRPGPAVMNAGDNLVTAALALVGERRHVALTKNIPAGAGLGGGSSDAAAILRWAGFEDLEQAANLGADVAFCLRGGRARVRGIGEIVSDLPFEERTFTLLTPPIHASTPVVYRAWDSMGGPVGDNGNDLEPAALVAYPQLAEARDALWELSGVRPRLAGSGSTWFVDGAYPSARTIVTTSIRSQAV